MRKIFLPMLAASAATLIPTAASAQRASILVVDTDRILADCTACKTAGSQLQSQVQSARQRAQALESQLRTEAQALDTQVKALGGKQPDAALQQKIQAFRTKQQQGQQELANREQQLQSIQAHVQQQIGAKVVAIAEQVRARRQASVVMSKDSLMAMDNGIDVTSEVLTSLNQQLPSVSVTPLPQQQTQSQPQGR